MNTTQMLARSHSISRQRKLAVALIFAIPVIATVILLRPDSPVLATQSSEPVNAKLTPASPNIGFADVIEAVSPAVISVEISREAKQIDHRFDFRGHDEFRDMPPFMKEFFFHKRGDRRKAFREWRRKQAAIGSGVIIDPQGYIVTNFHVVGGADEIKVTLSDGSIHIAEVVGIDRLTDLAVIKIDAGDSLPFVEFGDSDSVRVGDWVLAIGDPFGLNQSASLGIVSAKDRTLHRVMPDVPLIQVDAAVNRGNSGGPLFDVNGQVIGINTLIFSPTRANAGVGFAIPATLTEEVTTTLMSDGSIERGWLGVVIQPITDDIAEAMDLTREGREGVLVAQVQSESPAAAAGIQTGDIIVAYNGTKIKRLRDLPRLVKRTSPGDEVNILVLRQGQELNLSTSVVKLQSEEIAATDPNNDAQGQLTLGVEVAPLNSELRSLYQIGDDVKGVVIVNVQPNSPAEVAGLREGDVIKNINRNDISSAADIRQQLKTGYDEGRQRVLALIERDGSNRFVAIKFS